jgi:gluconolactonase
MRAGAGAMLYVITPQGTIVEWHPAPADLPMHCAFGDPDLGSLYLTAADGGVYRARNIGRRGLKR